MMEIPPEYLNDPEKRREWIEKHLPTDLLGAEREEHVNELNALLEWMYQAVLQIDEMPEWREKMHLRRIVRAAKALARDVGVEVIDAQRMGQLLYMFLMNSEDEDPEEEPEPQPDPAETVEV